MTRDMILLTIGLISAIINLACSPMHVEVDPVAAARVKVLGVDTQVDKTCDFVANLSAAYGDNLVTLPENVLNATNDLINRASEYGATHLLLGQAQAETNGSWFVENCANCVSLTAKAFVCH